MNNRNVIGGMTAALISPLVDFYTRLAPFLLLALVLIIADLRFGVRAARKRGEVIRPSRKFRRTINKLVDYICWITLAGMMGSTFGTRLGIPLLSVIVLCIVYGIELTSIFNNYFEYKGINKKFNALKFFSRLTRVSAIEESVEDADKEK